MLVDHRTGDDAGVFRLRRGDALVQTVDFFTPVVDDPEAFGAIAAANALSDVYAMGGRPLTALSIAAFPEKDFPAEWAAAIVRGGDEKLREAGCVLLGGHSVRDPEIKFGYAVTGLVDPDAMLTNARGRAGETVVLTKPLGTGVIATALKAGRRPRTAVASQRSMATLNRAAAEVAAAPRRPLRHRHHRLRPGRARRRRWPARAASPWRSRPAELPAPARRARAGAVLPAGRPQGQPPAVRARSWTTRRAATMRSRALLFDPQTSGGLLLLVPPRRRVRSSPTCRGAGHRTHVPPGSHPLALI